ncbi:MAG: Ig-like domain-containing protein [Gemmatimonadota bacterium]|nr:MAG: Ig-like domain-containing protein [Gemmatimonadota bacterium]
MPRIMRSAGVAAALGSAAALLTTCSLDELISPGPVGRLTTSISQIVDSAAVGSLEQRDVTIRVAIPGERAASWTAASASESPWLSLSVTSGSVSGSLTATLRPDNLPIGVYQDTILFKVGGASILTPLPVQFTIHPCPVVDISPDTAVTGSVTTASCTAPRLERRFAAVFGFTAAAGDSVSVLLTSPDFDAHVVLDSTADAAVPPLVEANTCNGTDGDPCLIYVLLSDSGRYFVAATTAHERETGMFNLELNTPRPPPAPSYLGQFMEDSVTGLPLGGGTPASSVVLKGVLDDPDMTDSLRLEVELQPVDSGFSGNPTGTSPLVAKGDTALLVIAELADNTDYRWLARAIDQTGRVSDWASFGANPNDSADFRVAVPDSPNPPQGLEQYRGDGATVIPLGQATPDRTVVFDGIVSDPDLTDRLRLEVEVRPVGVAFTGAAVGSSVLTGNGTRALVSVPGLDDDTEYHWQARVVDLDMNTSEWKQFGANPETEADFRIAVPDVPYVPVYLRQLRADGTTPISVGDTIDETTVVYRANVNDPDPGDLLRLQTETRPIGMPFTGFPTDSSTQISGGGTVSVTISELPDDTAYHWRARVTDQNGNESAWVSFGDNPDGDADFAVAVPATELNFATQPSDVRYGATFQPPIAITALEPSGATDTSFTGQVTIAIAPGTGTSGAQLSGTTVQNAVLGIATFADLTIDLIGSGYVLTASSPGLPSVNSVPFDVLPGSAGRLDVVVQPPASAQSGVVLEQQPAVQVGDSDGHPVAVPGLTITAVIANGPTGATISPETAVSDHNGLATFAGLTIAGPVGDYVLRFVSPGLLPVVSQTITLQPGPADPATTTAVVPSGVAGFTTKILVTVRDASGNGLSGGGEAVAVSVTGANVATATVEDHGDSTYTATYTPTQAGLDSVAISLAGQPISGSPYASAVTSVVASHMDVYAGDGQTAVVETAVLVPPTVLVTDEYGNGIEGVEVSFTVTGGGGTVSPTSPVATDTAGLARVDSWILGPISGANELTATTASLAGSPVVFTAIGTAGPVSPTQSALAATPDTIAADGSVSTLTVVARDANGNAISGADVALAATGAGNTVTQPAGPTDVTGQVAGTLSSTVAEVKTVSATIDGTTISQTATVVVIAAAASQLSIATQPSASAQSGVPFAQQPVVQVRDVNGNKVSQSQVTVTASIASGGGVLGGTLSQNTNNDGAAIFQQLSISGPAGPHTLQFDAPGLTSAISDTVNLTGGAATQLSIATQPSASVQNGIPFPSQPVIQLQDGYGNDAAQSGVTVTASIESGGGTLGGTVSVATDASGAAIFTDLSLTGTVGDRTLRFTATNMSEVRSNTVTVTPGNPSQLSITTQPSASAEVAVPFERQPVIQLLDLSGNNVSQAGTPITASIETGGGTLEGSVTVSTDANGAATFTDLSLTGLTGDRTLRFAGAGLTPVISSKIDLKAGVATQLSITTQPSPVAQSGVKFSEQPVIQLLDAGGNNVKQNKVAVTASIATGEGTLEGPLTVNTDNSGAAKFKNLAITGVAGDRTLRFTAAGLAPVTSTTVTVTADSDAAIPSFAPATTAAAGRDR